MARKPEHPLHTTLSAWGEWMRSGAHDNQGWPGMSTLAPERMLAETETQGIAGRRLHYQPADPHDDPNHPLKIPMPTQHTPTQPRSNPARLPRLNPPPPQQWLRITCALKQLHRDRITRASAEAVMRYYVQRQGGYDCRTARGADMIYACLVVRLD